jgi:DNA-binding MarR family transcriptional regulator
VQAGRTPSPTAAGQDEHTVMACGPAVSPAEGTPTLSETPAPTPGLVLAQRWGPGDAVGGFSLDSPLPSLVAAAARLLGAFSSAAAQGTGISAAGLRIIRLLAVSDGLQSSKVAARGLWARGTVTSVVDTLVRDGYVERQRDDQDRRLVRLFLTSEGRRKAEESAGIDGPRWQTAFDYVDQADEPVIRRFLLKTIERFGGLVREERGQ